MPTTPSDLDRLRALEAQFNEAVLGLIRRTLSETDYRPTRFMQMMDEHGALDAARILLAQDLATHELHQGLIRLWELGRLDLSIERLVAYEPRWAPLFSEMERTRARRRLDELAYTESSG